MYYQEFQPHPQLQPFIDCYWVLEEFQNQHLAVESIIPDGRTELILNYGTPFTEVYSGSEQNQNRSFIYGQIDHALKLKPSSSIGILGVRFTFCGLYPLVNIPVHEMNNQRVAVEDLLPNHHQLTTILARSADKVERVKMMDQVLLTAFAGKEIDASVLYLTQLLDQEASHHSIYTGYRTTGYSQRQLRRKFQQWTGWTPQKMSAVLRLQKFLKLYKQKNFASLTQLALASGYYDQAHFNRDFKQIVGTAPSHFFTISDPWSQNFF